MTDLGADGPVEALSSIAKALENRVRQRHTFDAGAVLEGPAPGVFFVRVPTSYDELEAQVWAARYRARELGDSADIERSANATLETLHVVANACRKVEANGEDLPAFGPPLWMAKRLKADEIERLLVLVNEARVRESGRTRDVDGDMVADLAQSLAACTPEEAAELCLGLDRDALVQACRALSGMVQALVEDGIEVIDGEA